MVPKNKPLQLRIDRAPEAKTFTTHRKKPKTTIDISRKGSIVKERCKQLMEIIEDLFPERVLSDDDLICLIQDYIGADKETVRSYRGYSGHIRAGRCGDNKIVGLSRKGYLEIFGYLRKIPSRRWMIVQSVLSPQDREVSVSGNASNETSNEKISISPSLAEKSVVNPSSLECLNVVNGSNVVGGMGGSKELVEEEDTEKERNFAPKISPMNFNYAESELLKAGPREEPDGSKVNWGAVQTRFEKHHEG